VKLHSEIYRLIQFLNQEELPQLECIILPAYKRAVKLTVVITDGVYHFYQLHSKFYDF
jgi:hypothetical protein